MAYTPQGHFWINQLRDSGAVKLVKFVKSVNLSSGLKTVENPANGPFFARCSARTCPFVGLAECGRTMVLTLQKESICKRPGRLRGNMPCSALARFNAQGFLFHRDAFGHLLWLGK